VAANNEYNDSGKDSNKPAGIGSAESLTLSPRSLMGHTCQARISGGGG